MFVDASALVALLLVEHDAAPLAERLEAAGGGFTSPIAVFETIAVLMRRPRTLVQAEAELSELLAAANISVIPISPDIGHLALEAFERFGKGRGHPAQLNMGDCFSYACARALGVPLLYKGEDFARTDIAAAP